MIDTKTNIPKIENKFQPIPKDIKDNNLNFSLPNSFEKTLISSTAIESGIDQEISSDPRPS